jgi:hypothetical protein
MRSTPGLALRAGLATIVFASADWVESADAPPLNQAGAFNLRIVSDSVPDWSSREKFVASALSNWRTDEEKALAQFRWMHRCRRVGSCAIEDSRPVLDPVLFFNSYGITYCSMISQINCSLWEAWGKKGRCVDLPGHVVSEVLFDDRWHMFDNDFCNYFINEEGEIASAGELGASRIHGDIENLRPGEYYVFDHCPTASAPRGHIFQGPNSWWLIDVARDWYPSARKVLPRLNTTGAHAGHRHILGIRPNERYTRHWRPLGTGKTYARLLPNGKDPATTDGSPLINSRGNGEWVWTPNLADESVLFASENAECGKDGVKAKKDDRPAQAVFRVMAANIVTSARMSAGCAGIVAFSVSGNGGLSWSQLKTVTDEAGRVSADLGDAVGGRLEYLVRAELKPGTVLESLAINTFTQCNPRTLPALRLGRNTIAAVSDEHMEYVTFNPRLSSDQHADELFAAEGWQSNRNPREWDPSIRSVDKAKATLKAETPRDIRRVRMACTAMMTEPSGEMQLSVNDGTGWKQLDQIEFHGAPYDSRHSVETRDFRSGTRELSMQYAMDSGGNGFVNIFAEVGYEPAGSFMPYDVTYCWSEFRDGEWVERRHMERVSDTNHHYAVNVGGMRPPRMNWIRLEPAGTAARGYSDGEDVGTRFARESYRLAYGNNVSVGCPYQVSRAAGPAFPDAGRHLTNMPPDRLLTDGFIGESSVWKLDRINLKGPKNEARVGELVVWEPGGPVTITVDLGKRRKVGAARVCAIQPNEKVLYPSRMIVETSADGRLYTLAGEAKWDDCFFPPGDQMQWEGFDSPVYESLPAGGMISYRFPILFEKRVKARYVRFRLEPPSDPSAGMGLYEVDAWDRADKETWDERIALP